MRKYAAILLILLSLGCAEQGTYNPTYEQPRDILVQQYTGHANLISQDAENINSYVGGNFKVTSEAISDLNDKLLLFKTHVSNFKTFISQNDYALQQRGVDTIGLQATLDKTILDIEKVEKEINSPLFRLKGAFGSFTNLFK